MHQIIHELHTRYERAGERPPYILVGHSYGGWLVRLYASTFPADVAMVLVDAGADNPWRWVDGKLVRFADTATGRSIPAVKTSNPLRESDLPSDALSQIRAAAQRLGPRANEPPRDKLPADAQGMRTWAFGQVKHWAQSDNPFENEELAGLGAEPRRPSTRSATCR